uniref:CSON014253 protein n=1 Tax=Culicoides sonorensis TaxID=179676 RepID=A0A336MAA1_CULSO
MCNKRCNLFAKGLIVVDDRSNDSSGAESDDSSGGDSPGPVLGPSQLTQSNLHNFNGSLNSNSNFVISTNSSMPNNTLSMPSLQLTTTTQTQANTSTSSQQGQSQKMDTSTIKIPTITATPTLSGNGVIYPAAALANLPQDVLVQLVQSGQLQIHTDADSGHQYITIPIPLHQASSANASSSASSKNVKSVNGSGDLTTVLNVKTEINND